MNYCLGFIFNRDLSQVLLMEKKKPPNQKGKLNGVGGKIENTESVIEAMTRETEEETGLYIDPVNWKLTGLIRIHTDVIYIYYCVYKEDWYAFNPIEKECSEGQLMYVHTQYLQTIKNLMENVLWIFEFIKDRETTQHYKTFVINY